MTFRGRQRFPQRRLLALEVGHIFLHAQLGADLTEAHLGEVRHMVGLENRGIIPDLAFAHSWFHLLPPSIYIVLEEDIFRFLP